MTMDIRNKLKKLPVETKWRWIKGHQDDDVQFQNLDVWSQQNVVADNLAKMHWNDNMHVVPTPQ